MALIDLYSDTLTKPTGAMRRAIAEAEVGDEQKGEDPTVNRLQAMVAELLGKEAAVFLPSGTMCNEIAIKVHTRPGDAILADRQAHLFASEAGGPAFHSGVLVKPSTASAASSPRSRWPRPSRPARTTSRARVSSASSRRTTSAAARSGRSIACARSRTWPTRTAWPPTWMARGC